MTDIDSSNSVGVKHDQNKRRLDLIPPSAFLSAGDVLTYGAKKYGPENWRKIPNGQDRFFGAALRHLMAWRSGEKTDPESGLPHVAHALTNLMFLNELENLKA
jgi:hypothetical protein